LGHSPAEDTWVAAVHTARDGPPCRAARTLDAVHGGAVVALADLVVVGHVARHWSVDIPGDQRTPYGVAVEAVVDVATRLYEAPADTALVARV